MSERTNDGERELFEAWVDGRLAGDELLSFERRLREEPSLSAEAERQRALGAALACTFAVPAEAGAAALAAIADIADINRGARSERRPTTPGAQRWAPWVVLAAAAALIALVTLLGRGTDEPAGDGSSGRGTIAHEDGKDGGAGTDTREGSAREGLTPVLATDEVLIPDLESLYATASLYPAAPEEMPLTCAIIPEEPQPYTLASSLASLCENELRLGPEAESMLNGPYLSAQWPTGAVLTGYPDGKDGPPVVVVAERDANHRCCIRARLPQGSRLRIFTWRVGKMTLTEITPHAQPRLVQHFEVCE